MKDSLRGMGDLQRCSETSAGTPKTIFKTPSGSPASISARPIATAVAGVSSLGLIITEQPAAREPATFRITLTAGKFHATNAMTGPTGSFLTVCCMPATRGIIVLP